MLTIGGNKSKFMIGVVGHRPEALKDADLTELRAQIRRVLLESKNLSPEIAVVSPVAEGADRLVAAESISLGLPLICLLPFDRDDYARDFEGQESIDEYRQFLTQAEHVVELPGVYGTPLELEDAYAELSDMLVSEASLLIAIWDGEASRGRGGTGESVNHALSIGVPVVWIQTKPPHGAALLRTDRDGAVTRSDSLQLRDYFVAWSRRE